MKPTIEGDGKLLQGPSSHGALLLEGRFSSIRAKAYLVSDWTQYFVNSWGLVVTIMDNHVCLKLLSAVPVSGTNGIEISIVCQAEFAWSGDEKDMGETQVPCYLIYFTFVEDWLCIRSVSALHVLTHIILIKTTWRGDFPGGPVVKNTPSNSGDTGSIPSKEIKIPYASG